jgi:hypothetical protein
MSTIEPAAGGATTGTEAARRAELLAETRALRHDVRQAEQARRRVTLIGLVLLAAMCILLIVSLVLAAQTKRVAEQVHDTNQVIADCTSPTGACAQEGSQRASQAIGNIIRAEIFLAECGRLYPGESGPSYDAKLENCVYARLSAAAGSPPRPPVRPTPLPSPTGR